MVIKELNIKDYLTKSNLPDSDYVINPYVGCTHGCKYCYASFMKRFTGHKENWGEFIDVKRSDKPIDLNKISGKNVFLSSVTDCYNQYEKEYCITRNIIKQLVNSDCNLSISTKSKLILRDIDLLKQMKNLIVCMSINTLDETFRSDMDNASTIKERMDTLKELHNNGIYTILFMSPIFPYITEWKEIIDNTKNYIDEYWFENLNLRGSYKKDNMIYHDTYFGGTNFIGEEVVYIDNQTYWAMNYYGTTLDESFGEEAMDKALRPALMKVGEDNTVIPVRGPKEFVKGEYKYTFEVSGDINCFNGIETVYKNDVKIYELRCTGGLIK